MKTIIIDDDQTAISYLADRLEQYDFINVCGTANTKEQALELIKSQNPDIIFLDIETQGSTDFDLLDRINKATDNKCKTIIYTGHSQHMLSAFRNSAYDYLIKPADQLELDTIMQRLRNENGATETENSVIKSKNNNKLLFYTNAVDFRLVQIGDIGLFRYNHELRVWEVILVGRKEPIRLKRSTNNETLLAIDSRFVQISQRCIININYLQEVNNNICQLLPPFDTIDDIKIGRMYRKKLIERFSSF